MQAVEDKMETIHLYVVREQPKKPYTVLPLLAAALCLLCMAAVTFYSAEHPYYEHQRLAVPAISLAPRVFTAQAPVVPTGVKIYPATISHGTITFSNGPIIGQSIPAGFTIDGFATDVAMYVPSGSANGYGYGTVAAHALVSGRQGNIPALAINSVIGASLYVRNLLPFSGGKDGYSVTYATEQDKRTAISTARNQVAVQINGFHYPCKEFYLSAPLQITVTWRCQFVTYRLPAFMHVTAAKLYGKKFLVDVVFIPRPRPVIFR